MVSPGDRDTGKVRNASSLDLLWVAAHARACRHIHLPIALAHGCCWRGTAATRPGSACLAPITAADVPAAVTKLARAAHKAPTWRCLTHTPCRPPRSHFQPAKTPCKPPYFQRAARVARRGSLFYFSRFADTSLATRMRGPAGGWWTDGRVPRQGWRIKETRRATCARRACR